jgi:hypothetical protein
MNPISSISSVSAPSALDSGRKALDRSNQQLNRDAQQIADPNRRDLAAPMVDSKRALQLTKAGAAVIKTADEMIGTLLDIKA